MEGITARLGRVGEEDDRYLARTCEQVAEELIRAGELPSFRIEAVEARDPWAICAGLYWGMRIATRPSEVTVESCARWIEDHVSETSEDGYPIRDVISEIWAVDFAFATRHEECQEEDVSQSATDAPRESREVLKFTSLYKAGKLLANHKYASLQEFLGQSVQLRGSALAAALRAVAAYRSRNATSSHAGVLLDLAWNHAQRTAQSTHVCLLAVAEADPFERQGELLCEMADEAVEQWPEISEFLYHLAYGLRICGEYDQAIACLDSALASSNVSEFSPISTALCVSREKLLERRQLYCEQFQSGRPLRRDVDLGESYKKAKHRMTLVALCAVSAFILFAVFVQILLPRAPIGASLSETLGLVVGYGAVLIGFSCALVYLLAFVLKHERGK
ncbi:hypothetical protein JGS22_015235 [Streptomyces sp. P38-E01]|uniref:Tetratricopeptide repeat protein n=1 Tax=Streptomyces tardus TaxID=2780544 RepID=A0A949JMK5_9ACTN|nr:hypothetical protein [Streptomyces tardus]MBU7598929.1 hypothetical protein [Streptomyces tardus]